MSQPGASEASETRATQWAALSGSGPEGAGDGEKGRRADGEPGPDTVCRTAGPPWAAAQEPGTGAGRAPPPGAVRGAPEAADRDDSGRGGAGLG
ncbi:hypothetical protein PV736_42625, partial [Streptomyces scabiei]|nr:hypothetical protein [Streptomyces scabiei]MDX2755381.1 hypothetical protein [Streptomyces scabiei]MDX2905376.1 hypothetical protein [Streptomyces scabiei]MDX3126281.1 hypothetical protein [Streptomyces scabiei]MDX3481714.1 hypothetical protein [Streptomyces scabiei]